jgi:two-component sensor histidine kinase
VASLLKLQGARCHDVLVKQALEDMGARVRSISLLHEVLYRSESLARIGLAAYVEELCRQLQRSYGVGEVRLRVVNRAGDLALSLEQSVPCGLLINELVSNAFKHAFPHGGPGNVEVTLDRVGARTVRIGVRDDGVGLPPESAATPHSSLGLQLVTNLAHQLDARFEVEPSLRGGASFRVSFELTGESA